MYRWLDNMGQSSRSVYGGKYSTRSLFPVEKNYAFFLETGMSNNLQLTHSKHTDW